MTVSKKLYGFNFCCLTKSAANIAKIIGPHTLLLKFNEVIFRNVKYVRRLRNKWCPDFDLTKTNCKFEGPHN